MNTKYRREATPKPRKLEKSEKHISCKLHFDWTRIKAACVPLRKTTIKRANRQQQLVVILREDALASITPLGKKALKVESLARGEGVME